MDFVRSAVGHFSGSSSATTSLPRNAPLEIKESEDQRKETQNLNVTKLEYPISRLLDRLLKSNIDFHPNAGGISNHYSMTMLALCGLGADDDDLLAFHEGHRSNRTPLSILPVKEVIISQENFERFHSDRDCLIPYRAFFSAELKRLGRAETLRQYLPRLLCGQYKGLFHPTIRVAFALLHPHSFELVEALSYFAIRTEEPYENAHKDWARMISSEASAPDAESSVSPTHIWTALRTLYNSPVDGEPLRRIVATNYGRTFGTVEALMRNAQLRSLVHDSCAYDPSSPFTALARLAMQLYVHKGALTTLHAVTGVQALIDLAVCVDPAVALASAKMYFLWLSALYIEKGAPDLSGIGAQPNTAQQGDEKNNTDEKEEWASVKERTLRSRHVHVIKMVFTCAELNRRAPDPIYLQLCRAISLRDYPW